MRKYRTSPSQAARIAGLLERAAEHLECSGWFQGEYWPGASRTTARYRDGSRCDALGALAVAAGVRHAMQVSRALDRRSDLRAAVRVLAEVVGGERGDSWEMVATWNDNIDRTSTDVMAALRAAARRVRVIHDDRGVLVGRPA